MPRNTSKRHLPPSDKGKPRTETKFAEGDLQETIRKLSSYCCTWEEMADFTGVNRRTLEDIGLESRKAGISDTKVKLRHNMIAMAMGWEKEKVTDDGRTVSVKETPSPALLIFLAKNFLGMSDKIQDDTKKDQPINVTIQLNNAPKIST